MGLGVDWTAGIKAWWARRITLGLLIVWSEMGQGREGCALTCPSNSEGKCLGVQHPVMIVSGRCTLSTIRKFHHTPGIHENMKI